MVSLGGLSAVFPGYQKARESGSQSDLREIALQDLQLDQAGSVALGKTFQAMMPGAQPLPGMQGPGMQGGPPPGMAGGAPPPGGVGAPPQPPMQPGQPSVPMQQAPQGPQGGMLNFPAAGGGMLQGGNQRLSQALQGAQPQPPPQGAAGPTGGMPPPQARPPVGAGGGGLPPPQGQFDLNTAAAAIARANPGIRPEILVHALSKAMPYLNAQAQLEVKNALLDLRARGQDVQMRGQDIRAETAERGQDLRAQTAEKMEGIRQQNRIELAKERLQIKAEFGAAPTINDQTAELYARRIIKGQKGVMAELGTGSVGSANKAVVANTLSRIAAEENISPEQFVANATQLLGKQQMARTAGQIGTRIDQAAFETEALIPQAQQALKNYDLNSIRTQYPTVNAFINATNAQLGSKELVDLKIALLGLSRAYASALNRGYQPTVKSQTDADEVLNTAWNSGQLETAFKRIQTEVNAVRVGNQKLMGLIGSPDSAFSPAGMKPSGTAPATKGTGKYEGFEIVQ